MHWLAAFPSDRWRAGWDPTLSDRTPGADAATVAYLLTVVLCWLAALRARRASPISRSSESASAGSPALLWLAISLCLALLAITRLFDIGNLVTSIGRASAVRTGFYSHRRPFQFLALLVLAALSWLSLKQLNRWARNQPGQLRRALGATLLLIAFAIVRALSWHYLDKAFGEEVHGVRLSWLIELAGTALVAVAAIRSLKRT